MSGRAGRRGIDDKGIVILMLDEKMVASVGRNLVKGAADPINSAFRSGYLVDQMVKVHVTWVRISLVAGPFSHSAKAKLEPFVTKLC